MNEIYEIIDSYKNGQFKQMLEQMKEIGWWESANEIAESNLLYEKEKVDLLTKAIKINALRR